MIVLKFFWGDVNRPNGGVQSDGIMFFIPVAV